MTAVEELSDLVRTIHRNAGPSVVAIGRHGRGSGFVVAPGRVLTNAHNLRGETTEVRFGDDRTVQGTVVGSDVDGDLAVLDVDTADAPAVTWADEPVEPGDVVVTITAGGHRRRAAWGQVTATEAGFRGPRGRPIVGAIEHSTPCAPGSSGAPVLDNGGAVVAINTHRLEHGFYLARAADQGCTRRRHGDVRGAAVRAPTPRRGPGSDRRGSPSAPLRRPRRARRPPGTQCRRRLAGLGGRAARRRPPGARRRARS